MAGEQNRDVVVIGASMGGVEALGNLVAQLPADLPAALLVVQHISENSPGYMAEILNSVGTLPAEYAADAPLKRGRIYIAPPGHHLLLVESGLKVVFGPRENRCRPAIDPLFRTAAVHYRSRVIGVVLTGLLGDGASGLLAIHRCGGFPLVQAPDDAAYPEMPQRALEAVPAARTVDLGGMGPVLIDLVSERAPPPPEVPDTLRIEARLTERAMETEDWQEVPSHPTNFTCPECAGALSEIDGETVPRYRCRVGHAFSADDLVAAKDDQVEETLWVALQTLQERAQMLETMAAEDRRRGLNRSAASFELRARESRRYSDRLRELVLRLGS